VRVTAPDLGLRMQEATFEGLRGDTLVVTAYSTTRRCPLASVTQLEVSQGKKGRVLQGLGLGFVLGAGAGAAAGAAADCGDVDAVCTWGGAGLGAGTGLLIGALAVAATRSERWEEVPLDRLRLQIAPQPNGRFGLGAWIRF
jgi:hypothetical protein